MICPTPPPSHRPWTRPRIARLAFLLGQGFESEIIARDPLVDTTPGNVRHQANRFGLMFRDTAEQRLPPEVGERLDRAARRRGLDRRGLIRKLALVAGADSALLDNILDDDA